MSATGSCLWALQLAVQAVAHGADMAALAGRPLAFALVVATTDLWDAG